jgi:hypothetical protein
MGLIINKTEEKTITIQGTTIEMDSVYGRIEFAGRADGKTLEVSIATYASKEAYESGAAVLSTDVPMGNINVEIKPTEVQGLETAHEYAQIAYEQQGYLVEIIL